MNFPQAVASGFRNTFNYKTRASRSEFWWFFLFSWFFLFFTSFTGPFFAIFFFLNFLAIFSLGVRCFHDSDCRGWWILVPFLLIVFALFKGTEGENRFGPDPLGGRADALGDASALELLSRDDPPQDATTSDEAVPQSDPPTQQHVHVHVHMPGSAPTDSDKASLEKQAEK